MEQFIEFIINEAIIMVPALWVIGAIIKHTDFISDKWIPLILLGISLALSPLVIGGYSPANFVQAILVAGTAVFGHQLYKQTFMKE